MSEKVFPASVDALGSAIGFIEEELEKLDCPLKAVMQITVCVEEMFVNVAHYAYEGAKGTVSLSIENADRIVAITLKDFGIPFDPLAKEDPDINLSYEARTVGGLGIYMVKEMMDDVSYQRLGNENIFTMKKRI